MIIGHVGALACDATPGSESGDGSDSGQSLLTVDEEPQGLLSWTARMDSCQNSLTPLILLDSSLYLLIISYDRVSRSAAIFDYGWNYYGLVLEKSDRVGEIDIFKRAGIAELEWTSPAVKSRHPSAHSSWEKKRVRLV